jgi:hypothetical protein
MRFDSRSTTVISIIFEVFTAVTIDILVFWVIILCNVVVGTNDTEEHIASIFRINYMVSQLSKREYYLLVFTS